MQNFRHDRPTLGVVAGWQAYAGTLDSFLEHVFRGIQAAASDRQCNLLLACGVGLERGIGLGRPAWPVLLPEVDFIPVGPWNTDGLIAVCPLACEAGERYFYDLAQTFPVVYAGDRETGPAVIVDNAGGIRQALDHLTEHGHRRIAFVAGRKRCVERDSELRLRAYLSGLQELGLECDPDLIAYGYHTYAGGRQAMEQILSRGVQFTAVLASNDESAIGAMDTLRDAGLLVPQDVAVIGFDDRLEARAQVPSLTTIHFPMFELGYQAVEFLLNRITEVIPGDELVCIPTRLVIRESCGCLPGVAIRTRPRDAVGQITPAASAAGALGAPTLGSGARGRSRLPEDGLVSDGQIAQAMTAVVQNESQRLSLQEVSDLCHRLVAAFRLSLAQGEPATFGVTIRQILECVLSKGDDLYAWQEAISILRDWALILLETSLRTAIGPQAEDVLHQARVAISEMSRGQASRLLARQARAADQLGWMSTRFLAARDQAEIFEALAKALPAIGIHHAVVASYQPEREDPAAWSVLHMRPPSATCHPRFPTRQFPPEGLYPEDEPFNLALLPLRTPNGVFGFAAFGADNLELCAVVVRELVAALQRVQLYQEAVEARQLAETRRQQAEEASRLKSRFLSMVSHELRTPLNLIAGLSDMLLRQAEPVGPQARTFNRKDLERIYISAQHLDALIRDVLDLAQSDLGQLKLVRERLDLREVLEAVSVIGEQLARDKGLAWEVDIPEQLPRVWGDRTRLRQIMLNLVNNAVKFTARGKVALSVAAENGKVIVSVNDTGLGIAEHEQEAIFDEFRQSERTTARGYGGLGLGLAICKRLVEMHGGEIGVRSSGEEGEGSTFFFTLPALEYPTAALSPAVPPPKRQQVWLLVKDVSCGDLLKDHLVRWGFAVQVDHVNDGEDWLSRLLLTSPDVVMLDLGLTSERGWEILKVLKQNPATQDIPVLFCTLAKDEDRGSLLELDYLTKPLRTAALAETLRSHGLLGGENGKATAKTILVVDDEPSLLDLHARILESQLPHCRVLRAQDGREALGVIHRERPTLVLLDLMMPQLDGFAVLEAMRKEKFGSNIPMIVVTGQVLTAEDMARLNDGVASVLQKGMFSIEETLQHVAAALARKPSPGTEAQRLVRKAMAYIHAYYHEPISRGGIAAHVGLSERHLDRCFRQEVGITPMTYLNRYRVKQAKTLLDTGNKGIGEIAIEVGFSTSGYFTRVFRDEVGVSPRAYLRRKGGGLNHP